MRQLTLLLFAFIYSFPSLSQGILGEIGFNDGYWQVQEANIVVTEDYSYFLFHEFTAPTGDDIILVKVDKVGNVLFKKAITPTIQIDESNYTIHFQSSTVYFMEPTSDGGLIIVEKNLEHCDVASEPYFLVRKLDQNGDQVWFTRINSSDNTLPSFFSTIEEMRVKENSVLIGAKTNNQTLVFFELNASSGEITNWFTNSQLYSYWYFSKLDDLYYGINEYGIVTINMDGEIQDTLSGTSHISRFELIDGYFYTLEGQHVIGKYDANFNSVASYSFDEAYFLTGRIKSIDNTIQVLSETVNFQPPISAEQYQITTLSEDLEYISETGLTLPETNPFYARRDIDYSSTHAALVSTHSLASHYTTIRYIYYSLNNEDDVEIERVDVELVDLEVYDVEINQVPTAPQGIYNVKIYGKALIKNNSPYLLESVTLNRFINYNFCGDYVYFNRFSDLNLAPGESMWLDLGRIHNDNESLTIVDDSVTFNLCLFTSSPNDLADLITENDKLCKNTKFQTSSISEESFPNTKKKVVKIVNQLGQEIKEEPGRLLIYIFDDGSSEKRIIAP